MKRTFAVAMALAMSVASAQAAFAQPGHGNGNDRGNSGHQDNGHNDKGRDNNGRYDNGRYVTGRHDNGLHRGWYKGGRIARDDWRRGRRVDYRVYHLRQPPRGYEWREVDGNYVMAAIAGGVIASLILGH
jgi:Ni/Co efflux regulator RcnB